MGDDQVAKDLQQLVDLEEIRQLKARCSRSVDTKDWDGYAACLTEDTVLDSGGGVKEGRDTVLAMVTKSLAEAVTIHQVGAPEITFTGPDTADGIWTVFDYVSIPMAAGPYVFRGYGHYHEQYVRTGEGWRIRSSKLTRLRVDPEPATSAGAPAQQQEER